MVHIVIIEHAQSNGMRMPLLDVDVANKNAQFCSIHGQCSDEVVKFLASSPGPPSFSILHAESIEKLRGPGD